MDKKEVIDVLKNEGLDVTEEMAATAARAAIALLRKILPKLSNGFGLAFNLLMDAYEPRIFDLIDQIDGNKDL